MEKAATDKELEAKEVETRETVTKEGKGTIENINCVDVINKEELLQEHGRENCFTDVHNLVNSSSNGDGELSEIVLANLNTTDLPVKAIGVDGEPVQDSFKIWKLGKWIFKFLHVVHESIFLEQRMMRYGNTRTMFNSSLKILFCKFNARLHEEVNPLKDHQQNRVWNPGGSKSFKLVAITLLQKSDRPHIQESMNFFYIGSLMQEHPAQNIIVHLVDLGVDVFNYF